MACSNCFNGCTEIISDQCVRYTGNNIPALDISTNDSLAEVESKIVTYILSLGTGTGIVPVIDPSDLCALVSGFLPGSGTITLNDVISALLQSICSLKGNVDIINSALNTLNADYNTGCLSGVTASSDTHDVLQAVITKLCTTDASLAAVISNLPINYVQLANLNNLIQQYIDSSSYTPPPTTYYKDKMVPYVAYEYYAPSLAGQFDGTGAGIGAWNRVFLCNGSNGTPDKRGRVAVGTTDGSMVGSIPMSSIVNPSTPGNPTYTLQGTFGANSITLTEQQMPGHNHTATAVSTADPHSHFIAKNGPQNGDLTASQPLDSFNDTGDNTYKYNLKQTPGTAEIGPTSPSTVIVNTSVTISPKGGGTGHPNVQPTIGAYFIMYIP